MDRVSVIFASLIGAGTLACLGCVALVLGIFEVAPKNGYARTLPANAQLAADDLLTDLKLFKGWNQPDVAIVLSGEQHGYLQPCGCTYPQFGGLTRRFNLIQALRQRGWPVVAADLGDINQKTGPQTLLKYTYSMRALDIMAYTAVNVGEFEATLPLTNALANYALNNSSPRVVNANLLDRQPGGQFDGTVFNWALADKQAGPKVGVFGLTGQSVEKKVLAKDPTVHFSNNSAQIVLECLRELKKNKAELTILLYQGSISEAAACARYCATAAKNDSQVAALDIILCVSDAAEPPALAVAVGETMIVEVGHKGRYVGVVGAFRRKGPTPFELRYQLVSIEPKLDTPEGQEKGNKMMALMEEYAAELKRDDYLSKFKQVVHPVQLKFKDAEYVGSETCKRCHADAFKVWEKSNHAHAYKTLVDAKHPSLRQFDGECIVCHAVGFGYKTGFESEVKTKALTDVGCESCHGPASAHVSNKHDPQIHMAINPYKYRGAQPEEKAAKQKRMNAMGDYCMRCHDPDNDVHFDIDKDWPKIIHMTPR